MTLDAVVAGRIKQYRLERGLSQEELAAQAGLNRNYVGMIERQENSPTVTILGKLAEVLGIEPMMFLDRATPLPDPKNPAAGQGAKTARVSRKKRRP